MPNLLLEIYNEEIPAGYIAAMRVALVAFLNRLLSENGLIEVTGKEYTTADDFQNTLSFGSPRRFVITVFDLPDKTESQTVPVPGPPEKAAFRDGKPTKAAEGFARKNGKSVDDIEIRETDKGRYCFLKVEEKGRTAKEILAEIIPQAIAKVVTTKSMTWIPGNKFSWPRPIRHILALLDEEVIEFDFHGIPVGRITRGHPFHGAREIEIKTADIDAFRETLRKEQVILDGQERKTEIEKSIREAFEQEGAVFSEKKLGPLLDEVTNLVEWPEVIVGKFDEEFLSLPKEIVEAAMMEHQRYFPMEKEDGTLINKFATVSNRPRRMDESEEDFEKVQSSIRAGNERVIRARLADAKFFYDEDRKKKLEDYVPELAGMVYHEKLGSNLDKVNRLVELCGKIGPMLGYDDKHTEMAKRAAYLCRADLVTQMVGEFPSLQGVVGSLYAKLDKEDLPVVNAIRNYYWPKSENEWLESEHSGIILLIADKLDSLAAFFNKDIEPKGNQDPYALRRAVISLFQLLLKVEIRNTPKELFDAAISVQEEIKRKNLDNHLIRFLGDRLLVEMNKDYPVDHIYAVLGHRYWDEHDLHQYNLFWNKPLPVIPIQLDALNKLHGNPGWFDLVKSVQRCRPGKIAKDLEAEGKDVKAPPEPDKFKPGDTEEGKQERELHNRFQEVEKNFIKFTGEGKYVEAGEYFLEKMKDPINEFYDRVFVNVDDAEVRLNRVRLTGAVYEMFAENFADMAEIAGPEKTGGKK